jgi:peptide/nickel transport system ATP-binding protein
MEKDILQIKELELKFYTYEGIVEALDRVNLELKKGEILGLVGETGCGKSVTGLSTMVLVPPPGQIEGGKIFFQTGEGKTINLLDQREEFLQSIRGKDISIIFQDPRSALNPVYTVKDQIAEVITHHRLKEICETILKEIESEIQSGKANMLTKFEKKVLTEILKNPKSIKIKIISKIPILNSYKRRINKQTRKEVVEILKAMRIADPERVADMYPHELSGGMAQRVVIAMALLCNPQLLIADEPTTNLDVTVQIQILKLISEIKEKYGTSILYITHDMGVIAELCDRVAVMYAGNVVEIADVMEIFKNPLHPYTRGLLECIPRPGKKFKAIEGTVPSLINPLKGCRFHDRCPYAMEICITTKPKMVKAKEGHYVHCHLFQGESE